jgi:hypothetical protein
MFWFQLTGHGAPGSVQVVRKVCDVRTDPVLRCFNNPEGLNKLGTCLVGVVPTFMSWLMV